MLLWVFEDSRSRIHSVRPVSFSTLVSIFGTHYSLQAHAACICILRVPLGHRLGMKACDAVVNRTIRTSRGSKE